jgi:hypothetical protein
MVEQVARIFDRHGADRRGRVLAVDRGVDRLDRLRRCQGRGRSG